MPRIALIPLLVLPLLLGTSCLTLIDDPLGRRTSFAQTQRSYTKHVRWGDIESAADFVDPELREEFLRFEPSFDSIRITDFDIGKVEYGKSLETATVRVTYHGYSMSTLLEKRIHETQEWVRPGHGNTWWVRPELDGVVGQINGATR